MEKEMVWFNTIQVAFILNVSDRTIRTRAKNHVNDSEMVRLIGKSYELSDSFVSLYRKLSEVIGSDEIEENEVVNEIKRELDKGNHVEVFTPENYALFEKTLSDYKTKSLEIKNLDNTIVGLVQDKMFLQNQLDKTKDSLTQNQWILAKYLDAK
jgi:intergrase/recombinase